MKTRGFTIVELLIVIVVIGILAAITLVTYNGIQTRAANTQVISGTRSYISAIKQYASVHSAYPTMSSCLGAGYPGDQCWVGDSGTHSINTTFDTTLREFVPAKPTLATQRFSIGIGNNMRAGAFYDTYSSTTTPRLVYYLQGINQTCLPGDTATNEGTVVTQCRHIFSAL